jgi:hypothetical protein
LLEAVARERLMGHSKLEKGLAGALVERKEISYSVVFVVSSGV